MRDERERYFRKNNTIKTIEMKSLLNIGFTKAVFKIRFQKRF